MVFDKSYPETNNKELWIDIIYGEEPKEIPKNTPKYCRYGFIVKVCVDTDHSENIFMRQSRGGS